MGAQMGDRGWFEVTVYRVGESANKAPSDTFTAHTLTVRPHGNLKIEWEGGSHGFTAGSYDRLKRSASEGKVTPQSGLRLYFRMK
jgi:hypothetical protein